MQSATIIVLACLVATALAYTQYEYPAEPRAEVQADDGELEAYVPVHDRSTRTKRGLLLLKKKLLLGALGLKAAKVGAVGVAGVAGALALKKKSKSVHHIYPIPVHTSSYHGYSSYAPSYNVEVHSWSG